MALLCRPWALAWPARRSTRQRTEGRKRKAEERRQKAEAGKKKAELSGGRVLLLRLRRPQCGKAPPSQRGQPQLLFSCGCAARSAGRLCLPGGDGPNSSLAAAPPAGRGGSSFPGGPTPAPLLLRPRPPPSRQAPPFPAAPPD